MLMSARRAARNAITVAASVAALVSSGVVSSGGAVATAYPRHGAKTKVAPQATVTGSAFVPVATTRVFNATVGTTPTVVTLPTSVVPAGATAVVVNTEVFGPSTAGYVRVTPAGSDPSVAVQEFAKGQAISNLVVVKLSGGQIQVKLSAGTARILMDVSGYYASGPVWHPPVAVDSNGLGSVSCTSETFCVATDDLGNAVTFNGTTWSTTVATAAGRQSSISCVSTTFCVVVDASGNAVRYNGATWSATTNIALTPPPGGSSPASSVSCVSTTFCVAEGLLIDSQGSATGTWSAQFNGTSWSPAISLSTSTIDAPQRISCVSTTFCVAVDSDAYTYNGTTWSSGVPLGTDSIGGISCLSTTFCEVLDSVGFVANFNGTGWSTPVHIDGHANNPNPTNSISCSSMSYCAAVDSASYYEGFDGTSWSTSVQIDSSARFINGVQSVSCPDDKFCIAVSETGDTFIRS
jgi:hypothetical protein